MPAASSRRARVLDARRRRRARRRRASPSVVVARLEPGDVHEDEAAHRLARGARGRATSASSAPFTGRSNLYAETAGVLVVDRDRIDRLNRIDPAITVATLPAYRRRRGGADDRARSRSSRSRSAARASPRPRRRAAGALRVAPFRPLKVGLVATSAAVAEAVGDGQDAAAARGAPRAGRRAPSSARCASRTTRGPVAAGARPRCKAEGADLLVAFGASATVDEGDVVPAGIVAAGGRVVHFGMPVDPGNLLVLGDLGGVAGDRCAGLRAKPEGERLRLGAQSPPRRPRR